MSFGTNTTFVVGGPTLSLTGGTVQGAGNLTVNNALSLGTPSFTGVGGGSFTTGTTSVTTLSGSPTFNGVVTWNNSGTVDVGGSHRVLIYNGATLNNLAGGIINDTTTAPSPLEGNGSSSTFVNTGTFNKNAGSLATQSSSITTFSNAAGGTFNVNSGTFQVSGSASEAGTINVASGAVFEKTGGFTNTGSLTGAGTISVGVSTLTNNGTISPGVGAGNTATLSITGDLTNTGTIAIELGGTTAGTQYDVLAVTGALTRGGTVAFSEINSFVTDGGQSFTPFTHASASGTFTITNPTDVNLAPTYGATTTSFLSSVVTRFTGASSTAWETAANWTRGTPNANKDAIVNVIGLTKTATVSTGTQVAKSLSLGDDETVSITGGSLQLDAASTTAAGTSFTLSGGTLQGAGDLTVNGTFNWTGGTVSKGGLGTLNIASGATLALSGSGGRELVGVTLNNQGTTTINVSNNDGLWLSNGSVVNNSGLIRFDTASGVNFIETMSGASGTLNNTGTIQNAGAGTGGLWNDMSITHTGGTLKRTAGSLAMFAGNYNGMTTLDGTGIEFAAYTGIGPHTLGNGAVVSMVNGASLTQTGGTLNVSNATLNGPYQLSGGSLNLTGGTMTLNGGMNWTVNGVITGSGASPTLSVPSAQTLALGGSGGRELVGVTLNNQGTTTINVSHNDGLWLSNGSVVNNSGLIRFDNGSGVNFIETISGASGTVNNTGTIQNAGSGTGILWSDLSFPENNGTLKASSGTLEVRTTISNNGIIEVGGGATFGTAGGPLTNAASGVIRGSGTVNLTSATLTNNGTISPGVGAGNTATLAITGDLNLAGGTLNVDLGGTGAGQFDKISATGNVTMGGTLNAAVTGGYTPVNADAIPFLTMGGVASGTFTPGVIAANFSAGYNLAGGEGARMIFSTVGTRTFNNSQANLDWGTALNWTGGLPGVGDTALISGSHAVSHGYGADSIAALTIDSGNTVNVSGGSLTVSGLTTLGGGLIVSGIGSAALNGAVSGAASGQLNLSGGTLSIAAASTIATYQQSGGVLAGSGTLTISGVGSTWTGGTVSIGGAGGLTVGAGQTLALSGAINKALDGGKLTNAGTMTVSGTGNVLLNNGSLLTNNGVFDIQSDAGVQYTVGGMPTLSNTGTLRKSAGAGVTVIGLTNPINFSNAGVLDAQSGTLQYVSNNSFTAGSSFTGAGANQVSTGGSFSGAISSSNLDLAGGSFSGTASFTGTTKWSGGSLLAANYSIPSGSTLTIANPGNVDMSGGTLNNAGTIAWTGAGNLLLNNAAQINNSGLFSIQTDGDIQYTAGGVPSFNNSGTLQKTASAGQTIIGLTNPMAINSSAATLDIQTGSLNLNGAVSFTGANTLNGNISISGSGGGNNGSFILGAGTVLDYVGGSHNFGGATSYTGAGTLTLSGATWTGTGTVNLDSSVLSWTGGTLAVGGVGGTTVAAGRTLALSGAGNKLLDAGKLTNSGTMTVSGTGNLLLNNGGTLTNNNLLDIQSDADFQYTAGGVPSIVNTGTLRKSAGAGATVIGLTNPFTFTNSGVLDAQSGTLQYIGNNSFTAGSSFIGAGVNLVSSGGSFSGAVSSSNLELAGGNFSGTAAFTGTSKWSGGSLLAANYSIPSGSTLTIANPGNVDMSGGSLNNAGTIAWTGAGNLLLNNAAQLASSGLFSIQTDSDIQYTAGGVPSFTSSGTLQKTASAGQTIIGLTNPMAVNISAATLDIQSGSLNLNGAVSLTGANTINGNVTISGSGGDSNGSILLGAGTVLDYVGGNHGFSSVTNFTGAGTLNLSGATWYDSGTVNLNNGSINWTGGGFSVGSPGGVTVAAGRTLALSGAGTKLLDGGNLTIAGTMTVSGTGNLILNNGSVLTNNGVLDIQGDASLQYTAGAVPTLSNTGTLRKSAGAGVTVIGLSNPITFSNAGVLDVQTGTVQFPGSFTNAGTLSGSGTIDVGSANTLTNNGTISPGVGAGNTATLSIVGNLDLTGGQLAIDLGGTGAGQFDKLAVSGNVTMGGTLNASLTGSYPTPVNGDAMPFLAMTGTASGNFANSNLPGNFDAGYNLAAGEASRLIYSTTGTKTFLNTASDLTWGNPVNWSGGVVPGAGNSALISAGFAVLHPSGNDTIAALTVNALNSLDISGGSLTVSGATSVGGSLSVSGGTLVLNGASSVQTLGMTAGALNGSGNLGIANGFNYSGGTVGLSGALDIAHTGDLSLPAMTALTSLLANATGHINLNGNIAASGSGNAVVLATGKDFNNAGGHTLTAGSGRWLVYSQAPATIAKGGLTSAFRHYGSTIGSYAPGSVSESGNGFIYASAQPGLTADLGLPGSTSHIYGDAPTATYSITLVPATPADNEDMAANFGVNLGSASYRTSVGSLLIDNQLDSGSYFVVANGLSSTLGYTISSGITPAYNVTPAPLSITANNQSKVYGDVLSLTGAEFIAGGLKNGQTIGSVSLATGGAAATAGVAGGPYPIVASAATGGSFNPVNYTISYVDGSLGVTPRPLTASFTAQSKPYDGNTSASVPGYTLNNLANGETLILGGTASFDNRNVGAGKTVNFTGLGLANGTGNAANYSIAATATGSGAITQLASVNWTGTAGDGKWSTAGNWAGSALPDGANVAAVSLPPGSTVNFDPLALATQLNSIAQGAGGSFVMADSSLNVSGSLTTPNFNQTGGTLNGSGSLNVGTSFAKSGGSLALTGLINIAQAAGALSIVNNAPLTLGAVSTSSGDILVDTSGGIFTTASPVSANGGTLSFVAHSPIQVGSGGLSATGNISLTAATAAPDSTITMNGVIASSGGSVGVSAYGAVAQNSSIQGQNITVASTSGNVTVAPTAVSTVPAGGSIGYSASAGSVTSSASNFAGATPSISSSGGSSVGTAATSTTNDIVNTVTKTSDSLTNDNASAPPPPQQTTESSTGPINLALANQTTGGDTGTFGSPVPESNPGSGASSQLGGSEPTPAPPTPPANQSSSGEGSGSAKSQEKSEAPRDPAKDTVADTSKDKEEKKEEKKDDKKKGEAKEQKKEERRVAKKLAQCSS
ncbi:MAG: hypothetical protein HZA62_02410 [Rhodocyclales bacterium]|nr:hypothetical protein [Rhodocyclales bacterium]